MEYWHAREARGACGILARAQSERCVEKKETSFKSNVYASCDLPFH